MKYQLHFSEAKGKMKAYMEEGGLFGKERDMMQIEKWGLFEATFEGKSDGNPYLDYEFKATFTGADETKTVNGFYDGDGIWRVRFSPSFEGEYSYTVS